MKNKMQYVSSKEMIDIMKTLKKNESIYFAEMDGRTVQCQISFLNAMNELFKFPIPARSFDGYFDWIRDLDWLKKDEYILVINNFKEFMNSDSALKKQIITDFEEIVLPWWQEGVEKYVAEGKTKPFNVYLVD